MLRNTYLQLAIFVSDILSHDVISDPRYFIVIGCQYVIIFIPVFLIFILSWYVFMLHLNGNDIVVNRVAWYGIIAMSHWQAKTAKTLSEDNRNDNVVDETLSFPPNTLWFLPWLSLSHCIELCISGQWTTVDLNEILYMWYTNMFWCVKFEAPFAKLSSSKYYWTSMRTFSALLTLWQGKPPVTGGFFSPRPVTQSFDVSLIGAWTKIEQSIKTPVIWAASVLVRKSS